MMMHTFVLPFAPVGQLLKFNIEYPAVSQWMHGLLICCVIVFFFLFVSFFTVEFPHSKIYLFIFTL